MGTPREPIQLVARRDGVASAKERVRLIGVESGTDWTARVQRWARERVAALQSLELSGFVLKARSPSCGTEGVRVVHGAGDQAAETFTGRGLFAQALVDVMPSLPIEDEERLRDPRTREAFLDRVRAFSAASPSRYRLP